MTLVITIFKWFKSVKPFGHKKRLRILQLPILYCVSLIMVTITSHIFTNIFRMVHFSAVRFTRGNEKNMSFLLIPKSPKVWEKSEAIGPGTFNITISFIFILSLFCCSVFSLIVHSNGAINSTIKVWVIVGSSNSGRKFNALVSIAILWALSKFFCLLCVHHAMLLPKVSIVHAICENFAFNSIVTTVFLVLYPKCQQSYDGYARYDFQSYALRVVWLPVAFFFQLREVWLSAGSPWRNGKKWISKYHHVPGTYGYDIATIEKQLCSTFNNQTKSCVKY